MTVFRLYQNAPFAFENNLLLTQEIQYNKNKISESIETKLNETQLPFGGGFVTLDGRDITGNETEIYLTFDYRRYKDWPPTPENSYAGEIIKKSLDLLKSCNIIRALYQIKAGRTTCYKADDKKTVTVKNYFFNIQSVEIVNAAPDDTEEYQKEDDAAAVWLTATAYRLRVKRNKLLEAYFEGLFDDVDKVQLTGGIISGLSCRSWKELLNGKSARKTRAAQNVTPAEKIIHSTGSAEIKTIFSDINGYYVAVSGTYSYTKGGTGKIDETGKPDSIGTELFFVLADGTNDPAAFGTSATTQKEDYLKLMQLANAQNILEDDTIRQGNFSPKHVYLIPRAFFGATKPAIDTDERLKYIYGDLKDIEDQRKYAASVKPVQGGAVIINKGARVRIPKETPNTFVEFGTITTRGTLPDTLANSFSDTPKRATVFPQITYSRYDSELRLELIFEGGKLDITQDLIFPLSTQNITSSEAAAVAEQRQSGFIQQAGAVVAGVAAIGATVVSGGAFFPAAAGIVGGAAATVGGLSGIKQNAEAIKNDRGITATQSGATMAIATAQDLRGCGIWTYSATDDDKKQYMHILYNAAINAAELVEDESENKSGDYNGLKFFKISYGIVGREFYGDSVIITQNARVIGLPREIAEEVETRLNAGAIICYGVDYLEALGG